ncbi:MAG TPA: tetratricopeptide repeat protein [Actinomycetota bacterium]|nr:tetratricopeptide repeat protein [Actinomycetota bacterium]
MTVQPDSSQYVLDVAEADFEDQVLRRSSQVPVVVDFWAEWCAPCRSLGPILERAVARHEGDVVLARVDVDQAEQLAMAFGIQGIPAVKAFVDGQVVDEFVGAQPAAVVERFVEGLVPSLSDRVAAEAATLGPEQAARLYREALEADPDSVAARVGLAGLALDRGDAAEALELLAPVEYAPEAAEVLAAVRLAREGADQGSPFAAAARLATDGAPETALEELLAAVREGGDRRDRARQLMLDVFRLLGDTHPLTMRYRRSLSAALF